MDDPRRLSPDRTDVEGEDKIHFLTCVFPGADKTGRLRDLLECPVCMEEMKPPKKIFQCSNGHVICELCKNNPEVSNFCHDQDDHQQCHHCHHHSGLLAPSSFKLSPSCFLSQHLRHRTTITNNTATTITITTHTRSAPPPSIPPPPPGA